jgi:hypothetical protein
MHKQTELTRDNVTHTKHIRFWSDKNIATSAYETIEVHRFNKEDDLVKVMLSEWILD